MCFTKGRNNKKSEMIEVSNKKIIILKNRKLAYEVPKAVLVTFYKIDYDCKQLH